MSNPLQLNCVTITKLATVSNPPSRECMVVGYFSYRYFCLEKIVHHVIRWSVYELNALMSAPLPMSLLQTSNIGFNRNHIQSMNKVTRRVIEKRITEYGYHPLDTSTTKRLASDHRLRILKIYFATRPNYNIDRRLGTFEHTIICKL